MPPVAPVLNPPSHEPVPGKPLTGIPVDRDMDLGGPFSNYRDQTEFTARKPLREEIDAPVPLYKLVDTSKIARKRLPQQSEIDPILKEIQTKILRQVHLPASFCDLHASYLNSPQFKDIYNYLLHHKVLANPRKKSQVLNQASDYMVLDQLLFKVIKDRITREYKPYCVSPQTKSICCCIIFIPRWLVVIWA